MMRFSSGLAALAVSMTAALLAQAPPPAATAPTLTPAWNLTTDFAAPESADHGQILECDGNGYISRLTPDGRMVSAKWVTGLRS